MLFRTRSRLAKRRGRAFEQIHFSEREEKGKSRFGALVPVDAILLEAVATPSGGWVVQLLTEVVAAEEPLKGGGGASLSQ